MDAKRLEKYRQWLYSWMPLIAERRWREAAQALAQDSSLAAVRVLAEVVTYHNPTTTSALDMLISLPYVASKDADYP